MQITELAAKLESVGFTQKQARVYVAALFLGPSSVQKIAEQAEINRATAYVILDELAKMGLVAESTEGKKTVFVAEPPEAVSRYLEVQQNEITSRREELKDLMPNLRQVLRTTDADDAPQVRFYKGIEGSAQLSKEIIRKSKRGDVLYSILNLDEVLQAHPDKSAAKTRIKKGIPAKAIYYSSGEDLKSDKKKLLTSSIKVDKKIAAEINLYPDRASFITYGDEKTIGVLIESPKIVETLRQLFELAEKNSRQ